MKKLNEFELAEIATPAGNPDSGYLFVYPKTDDRLYYKTSTGEENPVNNLSWYVVTDYGADNTGVADSTTNIQAAIGAAELTGGTVFIPYGTYKVTAALTIRSNNVVIAGEGESSKILASGDYGNIFDIAPSAVPSDQYTGINGVQLRNFYIESETARTSGAAIDVQYSYNFIAQDVRIGTFDFAGDNSVAMNIYDGIRLEYQSAAIISGCQIYITHCGVYFSGNRVGAGAIGNFYWDGLITGNCNIWGKRNNGAFVTGSAGVYIDGGTGGIQIEQSAISFFDNGIRVDDTNGQNRELFLGHAFSADDCKGHGIYITGFLNVLQITGGWSSSCGRVPVDNNDGFSVYVDSSVTTDLKTVIAGGTFLQSNNGIYIGSGSVSISGTSSTGHSYSSITLGPNVQAATITGGRVTAALVNNSLIIPVIRGVIGLDDSGGNIVKVTLDNVAAGELSSGTTIDTELGRSMIFRADPFDADSEKIQIISAVGGYYRSQLEVQNGSNNIWLLKGGLGNVSIGGTTPTARLHLPAQNNSAGTAPLKLTSGPAMDVPEDGAIEYNGTHYYATVGSTRYQLDQQSSGLTIGGSNTQVQFNNSGALGGSANFTWDGTSVSLAGNVSAPSLKIGTLEIQNYSLSNSWFGDNVYFNGTFKARQTGPSGQFYFAGTEGQFRMAASVTAGSDFNQIIPLKLNESGGTVSIGGNAAVNPGTYTGGTALFNNDGMSIGKNGSAPVASALIEMTSTAKGFLPPRMTAAQAGAISSPAEGLLVYVTDTDGTFTAKGWWGYEGSSWVRLNN